jgi:hypothetical protein
MDVLMLPCLCLWSHSWSIHLQESYMFFLLKSIFSTSKTYQKVRISSPPATPQVRHAEWPMEELDNVHTFPAWNLEVQLHII